MTGLFRPTILIPEALDGALDDPEPLRLSLLHEIAHAERSDHWFGTAASMAQTVWFFLPQVWWLRRQLLIDQEFLADRSAAERLRHVLGIRLVAVVAGRTGREARGRTARATGSGDVAGRYDRRAVGAIPADDDALALPLSGRVAHAPRLVVDLAAGRHRRVVAAACLVIRWPQASLADAIGGLVRRSGSLTSSPNRCRTRPGASGRWSTSCRWAYPPLRPGCRCPVRERRPVAGPHRRPTAGASRRDHRQPGSHDPDSPAAISGDDATGWHHVHIHRDHHHRLSVMVDGRTISGPSHTDAATDWLTIEPSSRAPAEFRDLVVTW